ncbi:hypothetical protein PILCRDRAFT_12195 [Piloderma croceum F 1598]|uniref:Malate dehydrogenase n=1 Tax=Piloderma croceum (strain F 1598) TaxID=765440 RepID=A0A0C3BIL3_PILCF|nr:hypothetical protein PILCRDRAFT_12195 [Piloderma croceum F 1598]
MSSILLVLLAMLLVAIVPNLALPNTKYPSCNLSMAKLSLPLNQTVLASPTTTPSFVGLGVGVQNYTCNATSLTYSSAGAVVEVFDISCLSATSLFSTIQNYAFDIWNNGSASNVTTQDVIDTLGHDPIVLGQHYFVANGTDPATGSPAISPVWDFTSGAEKGNTEAFVIAAVVGDIPAPTGTDDVDWLQLKNVEGELADTVYRVDTKGGQPPMSCTADAPLLSVKFTTKYWLFGGCIKH